MLLHVSILPHLPQRMERLSCLELLRLQLLVLLLQGPQLSLLTLAHALQLSHLQPATQ
jgi:hypothetical protein